MVAIRRDQQLTQSNRQALRAHSARIASFIVINDMRYRAGVHDIFVSQQADVITKK